MVLLTVLKTWGQTTLASPIYWNFNSDVASSCKIKRGDTTINENMNIRVFRFYMSDITFWQNDSLVYAEPNSVHLVDINEPHTQIVNVNRLKQYLVPNSSNFKQNRVYNRIKFNLGIDSAKNVAGVLGGDLDPSNGMYWTWQSGYINFKLEGFLGNTDSEETRFEFHIGGYQFPFLALKALDLKIPESNKVELRVDFNDFFQKLEGINTSRIMSPSMTAVQIAQKLADAIYVQ